MSYSGPVMMTQDDFPTSLGGASYTVMTNGGPMSGGMYTPMNMLGRSAMMNVNEPNETAFVDSNTNSTRFQKLGIQFNNRTGSRARKSKQENRNYNYAQTELQMSPQQSCTPVYSSGGGNLAYVRLGSMCQYPSAAYAYTPPGQEVVMQR